NLGLEADRGPARRSPARRGVERALKDVAARFAIGSGVVTVEPCTGPAGHINASYVVRSPRGRFFLQRLNTEVFRDHPRLMENVARVTKHLAGPLHLVPAHDGASYVADDQGGVWRMYAYIENGVPVLGAPSGRDVGRGARSRSASSTTTPSSPTCYSTVRRGRRCALWTSTPSCRDWRCTTSATWSAPWRPAPPKMSATSAASGSSRSCSRALPAATSPRPATS